MMKKQIVSDMNAYLANVAVEYVKLHNLHWNVTGKDFKPVHEYLESLYNAFADVLDATAEALKMHGEQPLASLSAYSKAATIKELESEECASGKVLDIVLADMELLKKQAEALRKAADEADLYDVVDLLEDQLGDYTKTIWFLHAMTK